MSKEKRENEEEEEGKRRSFSCIHLCHREGSDLNSSGWYPGLPASWILLLRTKIYTKQEPSMLFGTQGAIFSLDGDLRFGLESGFGSMFL